MLQRKRARPRMPNEKSSSLVSSKRFFWASVSTAYDSDLVSVGVKSVCGAIFSSSPCTRTCGGELIDRCKSEPCISTACFNKSGRVAIGLPLLHRFPQDFFDCRDAFGYLPKPAATQRDHAFFNSFSAQLERRCTHQDQFPEFIRDFHDFVEAAAPLIARLITFFAATALFWFDFGGQFRREA